MNILTGEALFLKDDQADIKAGSAGLKGLLAYAAASPEEDLLRRADDFGTSQAGFVRESR